jgi:hypothetical protein
VRRKFRSSNPPKSKSNALDGSGMVFIAKLAPLAPDLSLDAKARLLPLLEVRTKISVA